MNFLPCEGRVEHADQSKINVSLIEWHRQVVELSLSFSEQTNLSECNFTRDIMPDGKSI